LIFSKYNAVLWEMQKRKDEGRETFVNRWTFRQSQCTILWAWTLKAGRGEPFSFCSIWKERFY